MNFIEELVLKNKNETTSIKFLERLGFCEISILMHSVMKDLWALDIERLNQLYEQESEELQQKLLNGTPWDEVFEHRKRVAQLSTIIYKKLNPQHFSNPAEYSTRSKRS
ncbi:hypothetical protein [Flavisolibacter ginsengisoli]|nr:hypothetical protein [Flavisolibacter ginsengisoli]